MGSSLAYGVGLFDGDSKSPAYIVWRDMIKRCYCDNFKKKNPSYEGCTVCENWLVFSNFCRWFEDNYVSGYDLDKDLIHPYNKVYSPEKCIFVPRYVNVLLIDRKKGDYLRGVSKVKKVLNKPFTSTSSYLGKRVYLGYFCTEEEAHFCWLGNKILEVKDILIKYKSEAPFINSVITKGLKMRINYLQDCIYNKKFVESLNDFDWKKVQEK